MTPDPSVSAASEVASLLAMLLDDPLVIVDVGCRWGFADSWEQLGNRCRAIGFEPDTDECDRLRELYRDRPMVEIAAQALGSKPGAATIHVTREPACSSLYPPIDDVVDRHPRLEPQRFAASQQIELVALDDWCDGRGIDRVDFIKADTQGSELDVLLGASRTLERVIAVQTEVEFNPMYAGQPLFGDVDRFLRDQGFVLWHLENLAHHRQRGACSGLRRTTEYFDWDVAQFSRRPGQLFWADALFVRSEVARPQTTTPWRQALRHACLTATLGLNDLTGLLLDIHRRSLEDNARNTVEKVWALLPEPEHETEWLTALEGIDTREGSQCSALGVDGTLHGDLIIDFGEPIAGAGWREPHRFGSTLGRWSGPGRRAWIDVPCRLLPTTRVELTVAAIADADAYRPIEIEVNGRQLELECVRHNGEFLLSGVVPEDYETERPFTRVSIQTPEPKPRPGTLDPRKVGIGVIDLRFRPATPRSDAARIE
jgi:FkbM family methyltransferase